MELLVMGITQRQNVVLVAMGALGIMTNILIDWLQQIAGMMMLTSVCRSSI